MSPDVLSQCVVHACLPAFASRLEVLDHIGAISNRYRNFSWQFLRSALAWKANLPFGPVRGHRLRIIRVIRALSVFHLLRCSRDRSCDLFLAKGRGL